MYKNVSYSNMPMPVKRQREQPKGDTKKEAAQSAGDTKKEEPEKKEIATRCDKNDGIFGNLETDDIVLLIVAFVLLMDGCDDKILLAAIAYIFLSDQL